MNFANVKDLSIPEGVVTKITDSQGRVLWQKPVDYTEPFYVENITNEIETVSIKTDNNSYQIDVYRSNDKTNWSLLGTTSTTAITFDLTPGQRVYLIANTNSWYHNSIKGSSKVGGNIMSLLYGNNFTGKETSFPNSYSYPFVALFQANSTLINTASLLMPATTLAGSCYARMFKDCTALTTTPTLPATTLSINCYRAMFNGCTSLTTAPALPATTLVDICYGNMFEGCTSLITPPALPATTLAYWCYFSMFSGCTSLTTAPALPATTLADSCYGSMFENCTSLAQAPALPATTLADSCYVYMFSGCTSLTTAPALPATTLVPLCYFGMFEDCILLANVRCLATNISALDCTKDWLINVSATGTFTKAAGITWPEGTSGIPSGWIVQEV